jgi:hypothetical protein
LQERAGAERQSSEIRRIITRSSSNRCDRGRNHQNFDRGRKSRCANLPHFKNFLLMLD